MHVGGTDAKSGHVTVGNFNISFVDTGQRGFTLRINGCSGRGQATLLVVEGGEDDRKPFLLIQPFQGDIARAEPLGDKIRTQVVKEIMV